MGRVWGEWADARHYLGKDKRGQSYDVQFYIKGTVITGSWVTGEPSRTRQKVSNAPILRCGSTYLVFYVLQKNDITSILILQCSAFFAF